MERIIWRRMAGCLAAGAVAAALSLGVAKAEAALADQIAVAHTDGDYALTSEPFLLEGARKIRGLGSKAIKVFLQDPARKYPHNSSWPAASAIPDIVDVLRTDYFKMLFDMDFSTFILQAHMDTVDSHKWHDGLTDEEWRTVEGNYYDAAKHLFTTYTGTGRRFILEHWEADLYYQNVKKDVGAAFDEAKARKGFLDYFNARAAGVRRAKDEAQAEGLSGVTVQTAVELIWVGSNADNFRLIDRLDEVRADLVSYSMSEECAQDMATTVANIGTLIRKAGGRPWYVGELAAAQVKFDANDGIKNDAASLSERQKKAILAQADAALSMGAELVCLWQIYHNSTDGNRYGGLGGYGLIRSDGSKTALAEALPGILGRDAIPRDAFVSRELISSLASGASIKWLPEGAALLANGAVLTVLGRDIRVEPGKGLVLHTARAGSGRPGDDHASAGETVTVWTDGKGGVPDILIGAPTIPAPEKQYTDEGWKAPDLLPDPTPDPAPPAPAPAPTPTPEGDTGSGSGGGCSAGSGGQAAILGIGLAWRARRR